MEEEGNNLIYEPKLVLSPIDDKILFVAETNLSTTEVYRYNLSGNNLSKTAESESFELSFGVKTAVISGDGTFLFYHDKKLNTNNLSTVSGAFADPIYAVNFDGSIVIGDNNIFNGETFSIIRPLPFTTKVMELSTDGESLYLFDNSELKLLIYDM